MPLLASNDLRGAARALLRAPTLTASAVLCLGLGLGATAAISSAVDRALLRPLPFREPSRLVTVYRTTPNFDTGPFAPGNYSDLAHETRSLEGLAAMYNTGVFLTLPDGGASLARVRVTGNLFPLLGVHAVRGRLLRESDDASDAPAVAVVSEELWRTRFGADPALVGRSLELDGVPHTVVGVLPADFRLPVGSQLVRGDIWTPTGFTPGQLAERGSNYLRVVGRLAPGATVERAHSELRALFAGLVAQFPQLRGENVRVLPMQAEGSRAVRTPLLLLFGAVCMVLLIAATNVASLLLARGVHRRREIAVRAALGASRWAVMRPVLAEALLLTMLGVVAGLALAWVGVRTIGALAAERIPQLAGLTVDGRVLAFALVLALLVAVACGAVPAWRGASIDPQDALRDGRGGGTGVAHHRALDLLVVAEVALSLVLLTGAGLVMKGFAKLASAEPGFDPRPILTLGASVSAKQYPDQQGTTRFLEPALDAIRAIPGVEAVGAISLVPYADWGWNSNVRYEGMPATDPTTLPIVENRIATPGFFRVTGQRLIAGRMLRESDDERPTSARVVVVNEALARRDFPGQDAVGKRFYGDDDSTMVTIVGVVSDIKNVGPFREPAPERYQTFRQSGVQWAGFYFMVRARRGDPAALAAPVRAALHRIDPAVAVTQVLPMTDVMAKSIGQPRFYLTLLGAFAAVALVLAVAGLYGVMSYVVAQRTRELGIRSALGSPTSRIVGLVASRGVRLVLAGVAIGLAGSAAVTRLMTGLLYGVSPVDAPTWALATALLVAVGVIAALVPALRATRVDPLVAMRAE
jgi:predicted permease